MKSEIQITGQLGGKKSKKSSVNFSKNALDRQTEALTDAHGRARVNLQLQPPNYRQNFQIFSRMNNKISKKQIEIVSKIDSEVRFGISQSLAESNFWKLRNLNDESKSQNVTQTNCAIASMTLVANARKRSLIVQAGSIYCTVMRLHCAFIDVTTADPRATETCVAETLK